MFHTLRDAVFNDFYVLRLRLCDVYDMHVLIKRNRISHLEGEKNTKIYPLLSDFTKFYLIPLEIDF